MKTTISTHHEPRNMRSYNMDRPIANSDGCVVENLYARILETRLMMKL